MREQNRKQLFKNRRKEKLKYYQRNKMQINVME